MHELVVRSKDAELRYAFAKNANRRVHPELALEDDSFATVLGQCPEDFRTLAA